MGQGDYHQAREPRWAVPVSQEGGSEPDDPVFQLCSGQATRLEPDDKCHL